MLLVAKSVPDNDLNHYKGMMWLPITLFLVNWQHRSVITVTEKHEVLPCLECKMLDKEA